MLLSVYPKDVYCNAMVSGVDRCAGGFRFAIAQWENTRQTLSAFVNQKPCVFAGRNPVRDCGPAERRYQLHCDVVYVQVDVIYRNRPPVFSVHSSVRNERDSQEFLIQVDRTEYLATIGQVADLGACHECGQFASREFVVVKNRNLRSLETAEFDRIRRRWLPERLSKHEVEVDLEISGLLGVALASKDPLAARMFCRNSSNGEPLT